MAEFKIDEKWKAEHRIVYPKEFSKMSYSERLELFKNNRVLYEQLVSSSQMKKGKGII